jgi:exopolysaccharide biosynthesis polyprenyl glycosylphosphotransferase
MPESVPSGGLKGLAASKQVRRFQLYAALVVLDLLCITGGFVAADLLRSDTGYTRDGFDVAALVTPIYLFIAMSGFAYDYEALLDYRSGIRQALLSLILSTCIILFVAFYIHATTTFSRATLGAGTMIGGMLLVTTRFGFQFVVRKLVGDNPRAEVVIVDNFEGADFRNVPTIDAAASGVRPNLADPGMLDRFGALVKDADFVVVACRPEDRAAWALLLKGTGVQGHVLAPELDDVGAYHVGRYRGHSVMRVASGPLDLRNRALKRMMDLVIAIPLIVALSPLFVLVAIAIKLESVGPVFFRQTRMGHGNRLFSVLKFRSMRSEQCDAHGNKSASRDDERITRVGRLIRATSIDELPQLFNVIHGSMSLVGPRPHALGSLAGVERFWEVDQRYWHRHAIKPGITGLAQVRGFRGATMNRDDLVKRLQADLEYVNEWSLERDFAILLATFKVLIHKNAF